MKLKIIGLNLTLKPQAKPELSVAEQGETRQVKTEELQLSPNGKKMLSRGSAQAQEYRRLIRKNLTPDLLKGPYKKQWDEQKPQSWGHCYVASEAYYHLMGGKASGLEPCWVKHEGTTHHFLRDKKTGEIVDITCDQFKTPPDYAAGRRFGWLTGEIPSHRAAELIKRVKQSR